MGVVYKLKKEIVEFILEQKKKDAKISCRTLSEIVQKEFHVEVSKSSISDVLKEFNLSSPRGRRCLPKKKKEKFQIPDYRKEELFSLKKEDGSFFSGGQGFIQKEGKNTCSLAAFFCKIVLFEMMPPDFFNILGNFVENCPDFMKKKEILEFLFLRKILQNKEKKEEFYKKNEWFWRIENKNIPFEYLGKKEENAIIKKEFFVQFPEFFKEISYFKLALENKEEIWIDAEMKSVWTNPKKTKKRVFFNKFLQEFSKKFLDNVHSVVLLKNSYENEENQEMSKQFKEFIAAFENVPEKKIKNISLYNNSLKNVVSFDNLAPVKRFFIMGILPEQNEYKFFLKYSKFRKKEEIFQTKYAKFAYFEEEIEIFPYEDFQKEQKIRVFFLREIKGKEPFLIIISNIEGKNESAGAIINRYISRWDGLLREKKGKITSSEDFSEKSLSGIGQNGSFLDGKIDLENLFDFFSKYLKDYIQENYFSSENKDLWEKLVAIQIKNGDILREKPYLEIALNCVGTADLQEEVKEAFLQINQREICDNQGNIINIKLNIL